MAEPPWRDWTSARSRRSTPLGRRIPTRDDLHRLAHRHDVTRSPEEAEASHRLLAGIFPLFEPLDALPEPHAPRPYAPRDPGARPERQPDPYKAMARRCSVVGAAPGPLAGKRLGLKAKVGMAGIPMTYGSRVLQGLVPETDATMVTRLWDAGAQIVAVRNMDHFACSGAGDTSASGPTLNPHSLRHLAGGSSGGSAAALYSADIDVTIGGDQGGAIRIPASWCGVVGLKPTHSLVPYTGIGGIDQPFDHAGPMARRVADVAQTLEVIAGKDPLAPRQDAVPVQSYTAALGRDLRGVRIGLLQEGVGQEGAEPDVEAAVRAAVDTLGTLGATSTEVSVPAHRTAGCMAWGLFAEGMTALLDGNGMGYHWRGAYDPALADVVGESLQAQGDDLPPQIKLVSRLGTYLRQQYHGRFYAKAQPLRPGLRASDDAVLPQVDVLAMPTTPMKAHVYRSSLGLQESITQGGNMLGHAAPVNLTGQPAISMPCAKSNGWPVGLMLTGRPFDDATVLAVAHAFEQQVDWEQRR